MKRSYELGPGSRCGILPVTNYSLLWKKQVLRNAMFSISRPDFPGRFQAPKPVRGGKGVNSKLKL